MEEARNSHFLSASAAVAAAVAAAPVLTRAVLFVLGARADRADPEVWVEIGVRVGCRVVDTYISQQSHQIWF